MRKAAGLVKLLALAPGHRLHREQVMDALWPDAGTRAASNNLRQTLYVARRTLEPDPTLASRYLAYRDEQLVLCPGAPLRVDVDAFEEATHSAHRSKEPAAYRAAIDLYADDLLPADRYEEWAEGRRRELRATYLSLLVELAGLYAERGEYQEAIECLRKVVAKEPTHEEAHAGLMRLLALTGSVEEALRHYERLEKVLSLELGAKPEASARHLRDEIAAGRIAPAGAESTSGEGGLAQGSRLHNLPAVRSSFVGREREMLEVKRELAMTRLLTLTGVGGSGKTRLALEVARDLVGAYTDGVWLVELAPLSEGDLIPPAVAGALGVKEEPGQQLLSTLIEALGGKTLLLLLDNCEHLVDDVARLVDVLLDACPNLKILATSREALTVAGEVRWPVPVLSVPDVRRPPAVEELEGSESVRLFVERASARLRGFALGPGNAQSVAEICRRLEGIPLAIELAAARVDTLSAKQICERLEDSLKLLTDGARTATLRHRTLAATLDWSYDLLAEPERALFGRLSVFAGGWTLEAAEALASRVTPGDGDPTESEVLDVLSGLVAKSLVTVDMTERETPRYGMLEPIRQYASRRLEESGEEQIVRRLHAAFFQELAEEAESKLQGPEEAQWLDRLEDEHDNIRAAFYWSLGGGDVPLGLRLAGTVWWFWLERGYHAEGTRWLEEALKRADDAAEPAARAAVLSALGSFVSRAGDYYRAETYLSEAVTLRRELGDPLRFCEALVELGWLAQKRGDYAQATTVFEQSLKIAREANQPWMIARSLTVLAVAMSDRDLERARRLSEEALVINRKLGYLSGVARTLINLGFLELALGDFERAAVLIEESLAMSRRVQNRYVMKAGLFSLGLIKSLGGDPEQGRGLMVESLSFNAEMRIYRDVSEDLEGLAVAAGALGQRERAARLWGAATAFREANEDPWLRMERMVYEPLLAAARSQTDDAVWEACFSEGMAMDVEEAVEYGLSEEEPTAPTAPAEQRSISEQPAPLTRREREVAALVAMGLTNRRISSQLFISERTVDNHVANILKKLNLDSREQVAGSLGDR
ncbi:MAG: tetratricopeptide repeat protein [Actinomycetota bacterium]|nr:tetratricopeptide repeat protein [Actinomycetota bacterium]